MAVAQILIAEDDASTAEDLKLRLEGLGYGISGTTPHAQEALFLVQNSRPDLVLMDIHLQGEMDGIQAAEQLHGLDIPVIFVTGYCDGPVFERAKNAQPYGYVLKPYDTRDLKTSVALGLHRHRINQEQHRLVHQLEDNTAAARTQTGLVSICAYCKSIKDLDEWIQIDAFVKKVTRSPLTHGMCPDCFSKVKRQLDSFAENAPPEGSLFLG